MAASGTLRGTKRYRIYPRGDLHRGRPPKWRERKRARRSRNQSNQPQRHKARTKIHEQDKDLAFSTPVSFVLSCDLCAFVV